MPIDHDAKAAAVKLIEESKEKVAEHGRLVPCSASHVVAALLSTSNVDHRCASPAAANAFTVVPTRPSAYARAATTEAMWPLEDSCANIGSPPSSPPGRAAFAGVWQLCSLSTLPLALFLPEGIRRAPANACKPSLPTIPYTGGTSGGSVCAAGRSMRAGVCDQLRPSHACVY